MPQCPRHSKFIQNPSWFIKNFYSTDDFMAHKRDPWFNKSFSKYKFILIEHSTYKSTLTKKKTIHPTHWVVCVGFSLYYISFKFLQSIICLKVLLKIIWFDWMTFGKNAIIWNNGSSGEWNVVFISTLLCGEWIQPFSSPFLY